ncbi:MAG TPA: putative CRISPR-associated protein [Ktedonobacteraceae bacterium]
MRTIITTTGISLYGNTKRMLEKETAGTKADPTEEQMRQYLRQKPADASAEANSLLKIAQAGDSLILLVTNTPRARLCAGLLERFFKQEGFPDVRSVELQFQDREEHIERQGIRSLISVLTTEIVQAQMKNQEVIINATAGFKVQVVYSTLLGMLYRVPVKYIHEEFRRVITFNPVALDIDLNLFLNQNRQFFKWMDDDCGHPYQDVEAQLNRLIYDADERVLIRSFLEPVDRDGQVFLAPMAKVLFRRAQGYEEQAQDVPDPPPSGIARVEQKISSALQNPKHDFPRDIHTVSQKIARLEYVKFVEAGPFANMTHSKMGKVSVSGKVELYWADKKKAARLTVHTTAEGYPQTIKVRGYIQKLLGI